jgi:hypothetical protein
VRDWSVIIATIAGPILAVQAHRWIERLRAGRQIGILSGKSHSELLLGTIGKHLQVQ